MVNATPRPLYLLEEVPVHILPKAWRAPGPVWTGARNFVLTGITSPDQWWDCEHGNEPPVFINCVECIDCEKLELSESPSYVKLIRNCIPYVVMRHVHRIARTDY